MTTIINNSRTSTPDPVSSSLDPDDSNLDPRSSSLVPKSSPLISIVTPSYNQGKFLEKTILSVLEQGYPNLEYIIIDGGSTDESVEIIRKYQDRLAYWVSEPDRGQSHAINKGFERASGEIFGWLNSDDWYHHGALRAVADAFAANPEAGAVVGAGDMVDENGSLIQHCDPFDVTLETLYNWLDRFFWQPSCFFSRTAWNACGPLDEENHFVMDLDLWFRIAKKFAYCKTDALLSFNLKHQDAKTTAEAPRTIAEVFFMIGKHGGDVACRAKLIELVEDLFAMRQECSDMHGEYQRKESELKALHASYAELGEVKYHLECRLQAAEAQLAAMQESLSWRLTSPLRRLGDRLNSLKREN